MCIDNATGLFKYRVFYRHGATEVRSVPERLFNASRTALKEEFPDTVVVCIGGITILNTYPAGDAEMLRSGLPPIAHPTSFPFDRRIGDRQSVQRNK